MDLPRLNQTLPETLSESDVSQLLAAETSDTPLGLRDRALLEVLYASGLRASELASLRLENVLREEKLLRVIGKGNRERLVPVGEKALAALDRWLARGRPMLVKPKTGGEVFLGEHDAGALHRAESGRSCRKWPETRRLGKEKSGRIFFATPSPLTCSVTEPTSAPFRKCLVTPAWPPRRFILTSMRLGSRKFIAGFIPGHNIAKKIRNKSDARWFMCLY